jgi:hypothetical protein
LTADVDVTAFIEDEEVDAFVSAMSDAGFTLRLSDVEDFVRRTRVLPFMHEQTRLPLDVVLGGPGPEEAFLRSSIPVGVAGTTVPVIAPEELVVTKILAGRPKDLEDVRGILQARGAEFDVSRARTLLRTLEAALDQSDLAPVLEAQLQALARSRR